MAALVSALKFLVLYSVTVLSVHARFFLSTDHVDKVLESEEYVITILELYYALDAPSENGQLHLYTKAVKSENRENYDQLDDIITDLFLQVRVLKRLALDWPRREDKLRKMKHYHKYADRMAKYLLKYPTKKDFGAACEVLFHHQELEGVSAEELMRQHDEVSASDLYDIAVQALRLGDVHYGVMWLEQAVALDDAPNFLIKLLKVYNTTELVQNCARILNLCQKLENMKKADHEVQHIYRTNLIKVRAAIREELQINCQSDHPNIEKCKTDVKQAYFEHKPYVPKRALYTSDAFLQYKSQCSHSSAAVHPSVCRLGHTFQQLRQEVFHTSAAVTVVQYHDVYDRSERSELWTIANGRLDYDKKRPATGLKFKITKPALVKKLLRKVASRSLHADIELQLYLYADAKVPSDSHLIEGGRTQIICFLNVHEKPSVVVLPYLRMQLALEVGSCLAVHYGESTEAHRVQHAVCPVTDTNLWIITITL